MHWAVDLFIIAALGYLSFQDFSERQISWLLIPLLIVGCLFKESMAVTTAIMFRNIAVNICFILLQLILLTVYLSVKNKKIVNIVNEYLGLGDILFFLVVACCFSPINFLVFYISGTVLTLVLFLLYSITKKGTKEIPLAGAMAFGILALMILNFFVRDMNFYNDDFFISCFE